MHVTVDMDGTVDKDNKKLEFFLNSCLIPVAQPEMLAYIYQYKVKHNASFQ